jgi:hypothetical protein
VVPLVPVPQSVVGDPERGRLVVALAEFVKQARAEGGAAAGAGVLDGLVRLAQDGDDVAGPGESRTVAWAPSAGRRARGRAGGSGPRVERDRDRGIRAGLIRYL